MRGFDPSTMIHRTIPSLLVFFACFSLTFGEAPAQPGAGLALPPADTITTKDGKTISGRIASMQDGKIHLETGQGPTSLEIDSIAGFTVQRGAGGSAGVGGAVGAESAIDPQTIDQILAAQQQILQRLDALAVAFANLEQQLRSVQTNQVIESRRLTERTMETNPVARVVVVNSNIVRTGNDTVVVGQVMNQSESVVTNLQVQATLVGSTGRLRSVGGTQTKTGPVLPMTLGPGQMGTFEIPFSGLYMAENVQVNVIGYPGQFQVPIQAIPQGFGEY